MDERDLNILVSDRYNNGYEVISGPRTTGDGYYESCILDPEGNQVEIMADIYSEIISD